jgi:hypothetical protein
MSETSKQKYSGLDPKEEKKNFEKEKLNNGEDVTDILSDNVDNKDGNVDNKNNKVVKASAPMSEPNKAVIK